MQQIRVFAVIRKPVIASSVLRGVLKLTATSCYHDPLKYTLMVTYYGLTVPNVQSIDGPRRVKFTHIPVMDYQSILFGPQHELSDMSR